VFTRTKHHANRVSDHLERAGVSHDAIHGNKSQNARQRALERESIVSAATLRQSPDAADDWIVEHAGENDIVITADIPLASRCLAKGPRVLGPTGKPFTTSVLAWQSPCATCSLIA